MTRALVAFATRHGSTAVLAEIVAATLADAGIDADLRSVDQVESIDPYQIVVVGSAVYMNRWQGPALAFLRRFERPLMERRTWLFSSGPTGGNPEADIRRSEILARQPDPPGEAGQRAKRIGVRGHATFGGRVGPEMSGLLERWLPKGDWRDPEAVKTWAAGIAAAATQADAEAGAAPVSA